MFDARNMNERILKKFSILELSSLIVILFFAFYFLITKTGNYTDYHIYINTANGDYENYFYAYWLIPLFKIFLLIPFNIGYSIWILLSLLGVIFAVRVFNGNLFMALISYQLSFALFWGQISGIICGFLGLFWWALYQKKYWLAGLALLIAVGKPQSGGIFAFFLWFFADIKWRDKLRVLIIPAIGVIISLLVYPNWIMDIIARTGNADATVNISLYQWIGLWTLLLYLPPLMISMPKEKRFIMLIVTSILVIPYFLHTDLITLFLFPIGRIPVLLGYLPGIMLLLLGFEGQKTGVVVSFFVYISLLIPHLILFVNHKKNEKTLNHL